MTDPRAQHLEDTLREVLGHFRPQGHHSWEMNVAHVGNDQLAAWWKTLGVTATWSTKEQQ